MLQPANDDEPHPNVTGWSIGVGFSVLATVGATMLVVCLRINGWL